MAVPRNPQTDTIIAMRKAGKWPSEIARELRISRNTVIGICYRAGLSSPDTDVSIPLRLFVRRGEAHPGALLNDDAVRAIRASYQKSSRTHGQRALARQYGVREQVIFQVVHGRTWAHVA